MIQLNFGLVVLTLSVVLQLEWRLCHSTSQWLMNDNDIHNNSDTNMALNTTEFYDEVFYILNTDVIYDISQLNKSLSRNKRIIFPGTLWCGVGKFTMSDDELGYFSDTDMCCRQHDLCPRAKVNDSGQSPTTTKKPPPPPSSTTTKKPPPPPSPTTTKKPQPPPAIIKPPPPPPPTIIKPPAPPPPPPSPAKIMKERPLLPEIIKSPSISTIQPPPPPTTMELESPTTTMELEPQTITMELEPPTTTMELEPPPPTMTTTMKPQPPTTIINPPPAPPQYQAPSPPYYPQRRPTSHVAPSPYYFKQQQPRYEAPSPFYHPHQQQYPYQAPSPSYYSQHRPPLPSQQQQPFYQQGLPRSYVPSQEVAEELEELSRMLRIQKPRQPRWGIGFADCECDRKFYSCLYAVNNAISRKVGALYFNMFHTRCVTIDHPVLRCTSRQGLMGWRCIEYQVDTTKPMVSQWRDNAYFHLLT